MFNDFSKIAFRIFFIGLLITLVSCDLLTTRNPEDPDSSNLTTVTATDPELLFENFVNSFSDKAVENYMACFVDSLFLDANYTFVPSAGAATSYPSLQDWDLYSEQQHFNQLLVLSNEDLPVVLNLLNEEKLQSSDSATVRFDYNLQINAVDERIIDSYSGIAEFKIKLDSRNIWVITRWTDIKKDDNVSWSELKGQFN